jgi:acyl dehydratase
VTEAASIKPGINDNQLPTASYTINRSDLIRYAGASGDFNPIHWSDRIAHAAGLPCVIAHGMLLMALASRAVTGWAGTNGIMESLDTRFTRPAPVPDDTDGLLVCIEGTITETLPEHRYRITATVSSSQGTVVARCAAIVRERPA